MPRRGVTPAEPYKEPPPRRTFYNHHTRQPQGAESTCDHTGDSEFSGGGGLVPDHLNGLPPSMGGQYLPKAPAVRLRSPDSLRPYQPRRPHNEARGNPGTQVKR